ncbi:hypothetical protein B9Z55_027278 [Caenorhabditis nigoni]|uniref:Uncharacterized protein n=2 Tax=Caenorhabditis nigoni TaxID=1611254 RepID=A0A2G5SHD4_9PELO|nr:hypothetical protein B9Z55_027278 [Caenorhabditis nigoni]
MKMHLLFTFLLLAIASSVTSYHYSHVTVAILEPIHDGELREGELNELNRGRVRYAKEKDIGNMHELKLDENLFKTAYSIANCEDKKGDFEIVKVSELFETSGTSPTVPKIFHPMQTLIACAPNLPTCKKYSESICLLGPYSNPTDDQIERGTIGSKCPHGALESELCKVPRPEPKRRDWPVATQRPQMEPIEPTAADPVTDSSIQRSSFITFVLALIVIMVLF